MFMGKYLKGNNMAQIKSIMADVMPMRKFLMLILLFKLKFNYIYKNVHGTVFKGQ